MESALFVAATSIAGLIVLGLASPAPAHAAEKSIGHISRLQE